MIYKCYDVAKVHFGKFITGVSFVYDLLLIESLVKYSNKSCYYSMHIIWNIMNNFHLVTLSAHHHYIVCNYLSFIFSK